jgi:hypothetical protein
LAGWGEIDPGGEISKQPYFGFLIHWPVFGKYLIDAN